MDNLGKWIGEAQACAVSWSTYGFDLTNREWAGLFWLVVLFILVAIMALLKPRMRSNLLGILKIAFFSELILIWITYIIWIILFVQITDWVGIWRVTLTKDTLVWSATAGLVLLTGFTDAKKLGYFRREFYKIVSIVVVFEYIVNFSSFRFWIELILQPVIFLFAVAPIVAEDTQSQETSRRARVWFFTILGVVIIVHTIRTLYAAQQTIDYSYFALQAVWPMLMGIWVLILVFPLAIVASYEEAFVQLRRNRDERKGLWKAKLGLVLALRIRLRLIREAANGGTYDVANAESLNDAYEEAKCYKNEIIARKRSEARK